MTILRQSPMSRRPRYAPESRRRDGRAARTRPYVTHMIHQRAADELRFLDWVLAATQPSTPHRLGAWTPRTTNRRAEIVAPATSNAPTLPFRVLEVGS